MSNETIYSDPEVAKAVDAFLAANGMGERMTGLGFVWWETKGWIRHLFGVHTLIATEVWTRKTDGGIAVNKGGYRCWRCEYWEAP